MVQGTNVSGALRLEATFYATARGREPVREWLLSLPRSERKQVGVEIAYVQFKWPIGRPRVDHLRGPLWEARIVLPNRIARVLFAVAGNEMVLLHGFVKKSRTTPYQDIALAEQRWKEWLNAEKK